MKNLFIFFISTVIIVSNIIKISYCMEGTRDMNNKFKKMDLVEKFRLEKTDKIIIKTNKQNFEKIPDINKTITDKDIIKKLLSNLGNNQYLDDFIRGLPHYYVTFYDRDKEIFMLGVNNWEDGGFIRVGNKDIESDLLPDKNFFEAFNKIIGEKGGRL